MFLLLLAMFDIIFCKDFPALDLSPFYNQLKHNAGKEFHPPIENNKPIKTFQTFEKSKFWAGLDLLVTHFKIHLKIIHFINLNFYTKVYLVDPPDLCYSDSSITH